MADSKQNGQPGDETVLLAHVTVHLLSGESFELLPFEDDRDVKSRVSDLLEDWQDSGFLIRGNRIYPWHQVQFVEATDVQELARAESARRMEEWRGREVYRLQQSFWRTKPEPEGKEKNQKDEKK